MHSLLYRSCAGTLLCLFLCNIFQIGAYAESHSDELIYPLKEISKLECRFQDFDTLESNCKQALPILSSKDYNKYAQKNGGYNDFTRIYTVLWGASYKYGWDVGSGGHQGTDFATAKGTPVYSIADGVVIESDFGLGWGNYVSIEHEIHGKKIISNYAHLATRDVKVGDTIKVGDKLGGVGSTGNSTGNHLHFQIDLPSEYHPYYYDYASCPHAYYTITETGVCFEELQKNTFDPLVFLENNGVITDITPQKIVKKEDTKNTETLNNSSQKQEISSPDLNNETQKLEIFSIYLTPDVGEADDIKEMQRIYNKLGYYSGNISGEYDDIYESIIAYQLDRGVINDRSDLGAGWFGPKTRAQTEDDYNQYVASGGQSIIQVSQVSQPGVAYVPKTQQTQSVSRTNLMTREEREAKAMKDFIKNNPTSIQNDTSEINIGDTTLAYIRINNSRDKAFRGNTPGLIHFEYDSELVSVFPESFFYFENGEREIQIHGKTTGTAEITIRIGSQIIDTIQLKITESQDNVGEIQPKKAKIYTPSDDTALVVMKDTQGNNMIETDYTGQFEIEANHNLLEYCIKRGSIEDILAIYKRDCRPEEYQSELEFDYDDTVGGILIFDYKLPKNVQREIDLALIHTGTGVQLANETANPELGDVSYAH